MTHQNSDDTGVPCNKYRIISGYAGEKFVVPFLCCSEEVMS